MSNDPFVEFMSAADDPSVSVRDWVTRMERRAVEWLRTQNADRDDFAVRDAVTLYIALQRRGTHILLTPPPLAKLPADATLRQKQTHFVHMLTRLLAHAESHGYEVTLGDAYRDPRAFGAQGSNSLIGGGLAPYGEARSAHKLRLAVDLNLFVEGKLRTDTESHRSLGLYWESMGGSWGGRFSDGNHYSLAHGGVK